MSDVNTMDFDAGRNETSKASLDHLKEIKVKVPVRLLLKLHYAKITESRLMGDLVTDALTQYFQDVAGDTQGADAVGSGTGNIS